MPPSPLAAMREETWRIKIATLGLRLSAAHIHLSMCAIARSWNLRRDFVFIVSSSQAQESYAVETLTMVCGKITEELASKKRNWIEFNRQHKFAAAAGLKSIRHLAIYHGVAELWLFMVQSAARDSP